MKKSILVLTGVAVLAAGAYFGSLSAQQPAGPGATGAAHAQPGTRIAIVNVGYVFNKFDRAATFKAEIEDLLKNPKKDAMKMIDDMKAWDAESKKPGLDPRKKDEYEAAVRNTKRKLEDMNLEIQKLIGKKQEDNLVTLWKDVNMGIETIAKAWGYQIVLGYGDPMEKEMMALFPNINRKMQAMDMGSSVPLYVHGSVDLSKPVTDTLNSWFKQTSKSPPVTPTSGTK